MSLSVVQKVKSFPSYKRGCSKDFFRSIFNKLSVAGFLAGISILAQAQPPQKVLDIQHWTTKKGVPVYFVQTKELPILVTQIGFDAGSARDGAHEGVAFLVNTLMNDGNAGLSEAQMAEGFDRIGAEYSHWTDRDKTVFQLKTVTDKNKLESAVDYFTKIFKPDFLPAALVREKGQQKIAISREGESPMKVAQKALWAAIYGKHPYGHSVMGTSASLDNIQMKDVKRFFKQYYVASNAVISLAGSVDLATAKAIAEKITYFLPKGKKPSPLPQADFTSTVSKNIAYNSTQTVIALGQLGITYQDPSYFPLILGNYILGGDPLISRLADEVRQKRGLTYGILSGFEPLFGTGPFSIMFATQTDKSMEALNVTQQTLKQFLKTGPTNQELAEAKRFMKGNFPLRFQTNDEIASISFIIGFYGLPLDRLDTYLAKINAVTAEQIKIAFQKHVFPEKMDTVIVGKNAQQ